MKRLLFIFALITPLLVHCQTPFWNLTQATTANSSDQITIVAGTSGSSETYRITKEDWQSALDTRILVLENSSPTYGAATRIPYMNAGATAFSYSANLSYDEDTIRLNDVVKVQERMYFGEHAREGLYKYGDTLIMMTGGANIWHFSNSKVKVNSSLFVPGISRAVDFGSSTEYFDQGYFDRMHFGKTNTYMDSSNFFMPELATAGKQAQQLYRNPTTGQITWGDTLTGGGTSTDSTWTSLSSDTVFAQRIYFSATQSDSIGIYRSGTSLLFKVYDAGSFSLNPASIMFWKELLPQSSRSLNLGSSAAYFNEAHLTKVNVDSADHEVYTSGDNLMFKDGNNAAGVSLSALASTAATDSSWVSITIDGVEIDSTDAVNINSLGNSVTVPYTIPWAFVDSSVISLSRDFAPFHWAGSADTVDIDSVWVGAITSGTPDVDFNMYINDTLNTTATSAVAVFSASQTISGNSKTVGQWFTPNGRAYILPNEKIWIRFTETTTKPEHGLTIQVNGTVY